jgi:oligoendopeptidase F
MSETMTSSKYKTNWNLAKYFYNGINDPKIQEDIDKWIKLENEYIEYFKENSLANADADLLLKSYQMGEEINNTIYPVWLYYSYLSSLDTQDQEVLKKEAQLENIYSKLSKESLFIQEDLKKLGYKKLMKLSNDDKLADYKNSVIRIANGLKYNLPKSKEELIIEKDKGGVDILAKMHEELTNSFTFNYRGQEMTGAEVGALRGDADESVRKDATLSKREVYGSKQNKITLGSIYKGLVKDKVNEDRMRGVKHVMESRNNSEQLNKETVDTLLSCVQGFYHTYHKYMMVKCLLLNKEHLEEWDRNAPYVIGEQKEIPFEEGLEMYLDVIKKFDKEFYNYSVDMFESGRVDVYPNKGKRGGAYAQYVKNVESFVLLNYTNKLDDVLTLAHELGHAIHGHLSQEQKSAVFSSPLSLAETASIFNETLMFDSLLEKIDDRDEKISILVERLDGAFNTIFRQVQIVLFEREIHERIRNEEELSYVDFNKIWRRLTSELYGKAVHFDNDAEDDAMWSYIPHIFRTPFYCYTYAFGNLLSLSLYEMYKNEGDAFIPKYKEILKAGGSVPPEELLMRYGIDITKPEFYNGGLKVIDDLVDELMAVVGN